MSPMVSSYDSYRPVYTSVIHDLYASIMTRLHLIYTSIVYTYLSVYEGLRPEPVRPLLEIPS